MSNVINESHGKNWCIYNGDSSEVLKSIPDNSIHFSVFSPPFSSLYSYSNSERDLGNSRNDEEFYNHFQFIIAELYRVIMPGRLVSFHCMNIPSSKEKHGFIGIRDFRGDLIRNFQKAGFIYASEVCIWKDPLLAATRTHALGLAHKQICKDSTMCRMGLPDYLITMRKPGENAEPVSHSNGFEKYIGCHEDEPKARKTDDPATNKYAHEVWQRYASPVWMDIDSTDTLQSMAEEKDERHICPLQRQVIERALELWSNPGDVVLTPFAGIGSEVYYSIKMGRKAIGIELKTAYWNQAVKNMQSAEPSIETGLFD